MNIEHGGNGSGLFSSYFHIDPIAQDGQKVKKGDIVATLYKDDGNEEGKLVHLHFEMTHDGWSIKDRICNPESIYQSITKYRAEPQGNAKFRILGLEKQPEIHIAYFRKLLTQNN